MTELSDAIARGEDFPGLSPAELAAAKADGHLSMCREPYFVDCDECPMLLARIQRLVRLVRPVIEEEARASVERPGRHAAHEEVSSG